MDEQRSAYFDTSKEVSVLCQSRKAEVTIVTRRCFCLSVVFNLIIASSHGKGKLTRIW